MQLFEIIQIKFFRSLTIGLFFISKSYLEKTCGTTIKNYEENFCYSCQKQWIDHAPVDLGAPGSVVSGAKVQDLLMCDSFFHAFRLIK